MTQLNLLYQTAFGYTVDGTFVRQISARCNIRFCPDVPDEQLAEAAKSVRSPLLSAKALIRNWHSMANLGIHTAWCPGSFYQVVRFTHPVSMGDYRFSTSPDEPVVLHFFVLTLGYSRRHYMEPALNERVPQFLDAHERAFDHFGRPLPFFVEQRANILYSLHVC